MNVKDDKCSKTLNTSRVMMNKDSALAFVFFLPQAVFLVLKISVFESCFRTVFFSTYSVDVAPLVPTLKLSINLTVRLSNGTVVPPL